MKSLEIFDPAISYFNPELVQFAADLKWFEKFDIKVSRHNFSQKPQAFAANPGVVKEMVAGMDRLPVIVIDGHIVSTGMYLSRQQLAQKLGIAAAHEEISHIETAGCCCTPKPGFY